MLDHVFMDAIAALRDALESAMLERHALEERFQTDVLLGDITWQTAYGLPGEGMPPRVQVELTLEWPTWAQTAYRRWYLEEPYDEDPQIDFEIVLRVQSLRRPTDPTTIMKAIGGKPPAIGGQDISSLGPILETAFDVDLSMTSHAAEVSFSGSYELDIKKLENGSALDEDFATIGGWITSALVRLGDLPLLYLKQETE